jgi:galactokinase
MMKQTEKTSWAERLRQNFDQLWSGQDPRFFRAPGRVNLIGEHTDYNDGFVLPMALNYQTMVAVSRRDDTQINAYSLSYRELQTFDLNGAPRRLTNEWVNYVEGMARVLHERGFEVGGANLLIDSDVPVGAGLSSSAAIEIAVGLGLTGISEIEIERLQLALAGQRAEHEFVGTKSGIMDQFVVTFGRAGHALLIDCRALEAEAIPLVLNDTEIIVCNSGVKHSLAGSEYNTRRSECEKGVELLREYLPGITMLRDVNESDFERLAHFLPDVIRRRCRHVITENRRTLETARAFKAGDLETVGKLLSESHRSMRDDFEISCAEIDTLVELAENFEGVRGARMTGGGFGGCTINLVKSQCKGEFIEYLGREYEAATMRRAEIFCVEPGDGAGEVLAQNDL